jgi:Ca2+-binding RTX toxin-like protein
MRPPISYAAAAVAVLAVAGTFVTAIGASQLRSGAASTVVPPAYYVGTGGADTLRGTNGNDVLLGRGGNDLIYGLGGQDVLQGGIGNDRLWGGTGRDTESGGAGNDRLNARDGKRDIVNGGLGFDEAWVDRLDVVRNVERIHRA